MYLSFGVVIVMVVIFAFLRISSFIKPATKLVEAPLERTVVTDADVLEKANPAFYQGVENGDVVLRYQDRLDLYRPLEARIIRSFVITP